MDFSKAFKSLSTSQKAQQVILIPSQILIKPQQEYSSVTKEVNKYHSETGTLLEDYWEDYDMIFTPLASCL